MPTTSGDVTTTMTYGDWRPVAQAVSARRHELGLSRRELAERARVAPSTIQRIEDPDYRPGDRRRLPAVERLEAALGWAEGAVTALLAGGDPITVEIAHHAPEPPLQPSAGTRPMTPTLRRRVIESVLAEPDMTQADKLEWMAWINRQPDYPAPDRREPV